MNQGRKISGGKYHAQRKKKLYEKDSQATKTNLRQTKRKTLRVMGGNKKTILLSENKINLLDPKTNKTQRAEIKTVVETPQNTFLARQNRLLKGAIIQTDKGKARITNRPSREGMVNAVLISE